MTAARASAVLLAASSADGGGDVFEVDVLGVDMLGVETLGADMLGVDMLGADMVGVEKALILRRLFEMAGSYSRLLLGQCVYGQINC